MSLSTIFKTLRTRLKMTQVTASKFLGMTERGVQKTEAGSARPVAAKALNGKLLRENLRTMPKKTAAGIYDEIDNSIMENKE